MHNIITYTGYITMGLFNKIESQNFVLEKRTLAPGQSNSGAKHRESSGLETQTRTKAAMSVAGSSAVDLGVSATHSAGWRERMVARAGPQGWLGRETRFLPSSPSHLCAEGSGAERTELGLSR